MLKPADLHVFTVRSNPLHWAAPHRNWLKFAEAMLASGVTLTVVECVYGEEHHRCDMDGVRHIPVRAKTRVWNKENLLNIGIHRTSEAKYIAWIATSGTSAARWSTCSTAGRAIGDTSRAGTCS